ncbi:tetratricopeptide repeat protein [Nitrosophilus alvini]|uniref:tetratricopeptide repeat protein n=1 Tax=Nitrosophilus alvini TaxID=2714855 RepID=UPI001909E0BB|nr:SEL1-like repeat protein [Nitrosophilus alvini]
MLQEAIELYEKDRFEEALPLFKELAKSGDDEAMYFLGLIYYEGQGTKKDIDLAIKWWKKADKRGNLDAKYMLQTISTSSSVFGKE